MGARARGVRGRSGCIGVVVAHNGGGLGRLCGLGGGVGVWGGGKRPKVRRGSGKTRRGGRAAGPFRLGGPVAQGRGEPQHYGYLVKIIIFAIMKLKFKELSPSMQGLQVENGRLINRKPDGQANVGVMGITVAAQMRKDIKRYEKEAMMTRAYVAAEQLTDKLEGYEM